MTAMPTHSKDIYGTTCSIGYGSSNAERVVRRHFVEGATSLENAIDHIYDSVSDFATMFPSVADMPLQNITGKQIGVGRYIVEQVYGWQSTGSWGNAGYNTLAEFRLAYEATQAYTVADQANPIGADGLPPQRLTASSTVRLKDMANANDAEKRPQPYSFNRPVLRIGVPIFASSNPMTGTRVACMGKVNAASCMVAGLTFGIGQLRFDGGEIIARSNTNQPFQGTFTFTGSYSFKEQRLDYAVGTWRVTNEAGLNTADLAGAFGIAVPNNPPG